NETGLIEVRVFLARPLFAGVACLLVGLCAGAQSDLRSSAPSTATLRASLLAPSPGLLDPSASARPAPAPRADLAGFLVLPADPEGDALRALFSNEPPQITRAELDAPPDAKLDDGTPAPLRYGSLPGGIVLGLRAHAGAALAADAVAGARLRRGAD